MGHDQDIRAGLLIIFLGLHTDFGNNFGPLFWVESESKAARQSPKGASGGECERGRLLGGHPGKILDLGCQIVQFPAFWVKFRLNNVKKMLFCRRHM